MADVNLNRFRSPDVTLPFSDLQQIVKSYEAKIKERTDLMEKAGRLDEEQLNLALEMRPYNPDVDDFKDEPYATNRKLYLDIGRQYYNADTRIKQLTHEILAIQKVLQDRANENENPDAFLAMFRRDQKEIKDYVRLRMKKYAREFREASQIIRNKEQDWQDYQNRTMDMNRTRDLWSRARDLASRLDAGLQKIKKSVEQITKDEMKEDASIAEMHKYLYYTEFQNIIKEGENRGLMRGMYLPHSSRTFKINDKVLFRPYHIHEDEEGEIPMVQHQPLNDVMKGEVVKILPDRLTPYLSRLQVRTDDGMLYDTFVGLTLNFPTSEGLPQVPMQEEEFKKDKYFLERLTSNIGQPAKLPTELFKTVGDFLGLPAPSIGMSRDQLRQRIVNQNKVIREIRELPIMPAEEPVVVDQDVRDRIRQREGDVEERPARRVRLNAAEAELREGEEPPVMMFPAPEVEPAMELPPPPVRDPFA